MIVSFSFVILAGVISSDSPLYFALKSKNFLLVIRNADELYPGDYQLIANKMKLQTIYKIGIDPNLILVVFRYLYLSGREYKLFLDTMSI